MGEEVREYYERCYEVKGRVYSKLREKVRGYVTINIEMDMLIVRIAKDDFTFTGEIKNIIALSEDDDAICSAAEELIRTYKSALLRKYFV